VHWVWYDSNGQPHGTYSWQLTGQVWPGLLSAEHNPAGFQARVGAGKGGSGRDIAPEALRLAGIRALAQALSDQESAAEVAKAVDAAFERLNKGLGGYGPIEVSISVDDGSSA
jgi:hypothetical protein